MKKILVSLALLILSMLITVDVLAQIPSPRDISTSGLIYHKDMTLYWVETDDNVNVEWGISTGATGYEIQLHWIRGDNVLQVYAIGNTPDTRITFNVPRAGMFLVAVRAYKPDPDNSAINLYSVWAKSNDPAYATVDGLPKGWLLMGALPAPGPIIP